MKTTEFYKKNGDCLNEIVQNTKNVLEEIYLHKTVNGK
jgi:hypothetical protein